MLSELVKKNRSYRRFYQDVPVEHKTLENLVELARLSASAGNMQPLKYMLSCDPEKNAGIFETLAWAAYLKDWAGPQEGERPSAYIVVLDDTKMGRIGGLLNVDVGLACQNILLGAVEMGLGGCMLAAVNRKKLRDFLNIPERYEIVLVVALGKPKETVVIETAGEDIKYWRDPDGTHHVPKRPLSELIVALGD